MHSEIREGTRLVDWGMRNVAVVLLVIVIALPIVGQNAPAEPAESVITLKAEPLGDGPEGVVTRITVDFQKVEPHEGVPIELQGSIIKDGAVVRNFRYAIRPGVRFYALVQSLPAGKVFVQVRLLIPIENEMPIVVGKKEETFEVTPAGEEYIASEEDGVVGVAIAVGTDVLVDIVLVIDDGMPSEALTLPSRIAWCTTLDDEYQVGLSFKPLDAERVQLVAMFLKYLGEEQAPRSKRVEKSIDDQLG